MPLASIGYVIGLGEKTSIVEVRTPRVLRIVNSHLLAVCNDCHQGRGAFVHGTRAGSLLAVLPFRQFMSHKCLHWNSWDRWTNKCCEKETAVP